MTWGVRGVTVRFGDRVALDGVTLDVPAGEVAAVVGGDGAGKTTLLRLLAGSLAATAGEVRRPDARDIGYLSASSGTYPDLSVLENVDFAAGAYGLGRAESRERAAPYLERAGLAPFGDRLAGHLSGGMRQKLGVIRAMVHRPGLLVLDEPTTGVGPVSRADLWWMIARAAAEGTAVVLATTYLDEAERATRLLVLDDGHPLADGTPADIIAATPGTLRSQPHPPPTAPTSATPTPAVPAPATPTAAPPAADAMPGPATPTGTPAAGTSEAVGTSAGTSTGTPAAGRSAPAMPTSTSAAAGTSAGPSAGASAADTSTGTSEAVGTSARTSTGTFAADTPAGTSAAAGTSAPATSAATPPATPADAAPAGTSATGMSGAGTFAGTSSAVSHTWRRGRRWRTWTPGEPGAVEAAAGRDGGEIVEPDLQDAVIVLALAREAASPVPVPGGAGPGRSVYGIARRGEIPRTQNRGSGGAVAEGRGCTRRFGDFVAVDDVDLAVAPGEVVGLLGANGAGKTTLIRLLLGLLHPSAGEARLFGEPPSIATRGRLGYVPQTLGLYDDLTAAENLAFHRAVFGDGDNGDGDGGAGGLPPDLAGVADVPVGRLSLGLQRRLAFVAALGHHPDLLVLDEPTSGVGPLARARLWEAIHAAADGGAGVLVTTHHMEEAEECDRLAVMAAGRVVAEGTVAEIVGDATVTVVEPDDLGAALDALDLAGLTGVALVGRTLRVTGAGPGEVERALGSSTRLHTAPATLDERFFQLVTG